MLFGMAHSLSQVVARGLQRSGSVVLVWRALWFWDSGLVAPMHVESYLVPQQRIEPASPALEGGFITTGAPGTFHINWAFLELSLSWSKGKEDTTGKKYNKCCVSIYFLKNQPFHFLTKLLVRSGLTPSHASVRKNIIIVLLWIARECPQLTVMVEYNSTSGILRYQAILSESYLYALGDESRGGPLECSGSRSLPQRVESWGRGLKPSECGRKNRSPTLSWLRARASEVSWGHCAAPGAALLSSSETVFKPFVRESNMSIHIALRGKTFCFHLMRWKNTHFSFEFQVNFKGLWLSQ